MGRACRKMNGRIPHLWVDLDAVVHPARVIRVCCRDAQAHRPNSRIYRRGRHAAREFLAAGLGGVPPEPLLALALLLLLLLHLLGLEFRLFNCLLRHDTNSVNKPQRKG